MNAPIFPDDTRLGKVAGLGRVNRHQAANPFAVLGILSIVATAWAFRPFYGARASSLAAFFVARALISSGLSRRIALLFVRAIGGYDPFRCVGHNPNNCTCRKPS